MRGVLGMGAGIGVEAGVNGTGVAAGVYGTGDVERGLGMGIGGAVRALVYAVGVAVLENGIGAGRAPGAGSSSSLHREHRGLSVKLLNPQFGQTLIFIPDPQ